ncbi:MAG TPA: hypothetical protein VF487_20235 [Chitinophagaceae bacterium]
MLITRDQLLKIVPNLSKDRAEKLADMLNYQCLSYGINTKDIFHEFLANVIHESGSFRLKEESMSYSAKRICKVWPSRFAKIEYAMPFANNPCKLAIIVYGGRMGNRQKTDDGFNFRGGGFMQLTGRDMYTRYQKYIAFDTVENTANAVRTDDYYALDSACWLFAVEKRLIQDAIDDKFERIVRLINGGLIGWHERQEIYDRVKKYI